jgi:hypothetical protein
MNGRGGPYRSGRGRPAKNIRVERPWIVGTDSAKATIRGSVNMQAGTPDCLHFLAIASSRIPSNS